MLSSSYFESITVVIPHHRQENSLCSAVQSVVAQSVQPTQILVVNDDDQSLSELVANQLLSMADNLQILETGRCTGGPAIPRNRAIEIAKSTYIAFLDADDMWLPWHLESLSRVWHTHPEAVAHGHQLCFGRDIVRPFFQSGLSTQREPRQTFHRLLWFGNRIFLSSSGAPCSLLRRYQFHTKLIWEDFDLWLRLASAGHKFVNTDSCDTLYRISSDSRSGQREKRVQAANELLTNFFTKRPRFLLPPWLLRNLYL